jgi:hypothetical protein
MKTRDKKGGRRIYTIYRRTSIVVSVVALVYLALLYFPQPLFGFSTTHGRFQVYSREPLPPEIDKVLDSAETRLQTSPIYDETVSRPVYLTGGFKMYAFFSPKAFRSFANSLPFINNIYVSNTDVANDRVFVNRDSHNMRSLSGVIAHETTHLFIRNRYGTLNASLMPTWKNEGYCEYVAGDSTISFDEGLALWRSNPNDDSGYRYLKYHAMIKYLLENEHLSVDDIFTRELNEKEIADKAFNALQPH